MEYFWFMKMQNIVLGNLQKNGVVFFKGISNLKEAFALRQ